MIHLYLFYNGLYTHTLGISPYHLVGSIWLCGSNRLVWRSCVCFVFRWVVVRRILVFWSYRSKHYYLLILSYTLLYEKSSFSLFGLFLFHVEN